MDLLNDCNDEVVQKSEDNVTDVRTPYATCEMNEKKRSRHQQRRNTDPYRVSLLVL